MINDASNFTSMSRLSRKH